jgi:hypothetical protein
MLRAIALAKKKNDRIDANKICDCLRCDFLPECYMASTAIRERRRTLRYRNLLVRQMVQMKIKISSLLMEAGVKGYADLNTSFVMFAPSYKKADPAVNNQQFRSLFVSKTSNEQYRQQVQAMLERKKFAAMTPQEIRDYNRHQQAQPQPKLTQAEAIKLEAEQSGLPPLPEKDGNGVPIDAAYINKVSVTNKHLFSAWLQRFGRANVVARMYGVR